jgi:hypothetical protein
MDNWLYNKVQLAKKDLLKDEDRVYIVDGRERSGKSVFSQQLAKTFDPTFTHERMYQTPESFRLGVIRALQYQCVVFDEGHKGFSSARTISKINKILVELMMDIGQKNLVIIVNLPYFFYLQDYLAVQRSNGLFHVYKKKGKRGFWRYYGYKKKMQLYYMGKTKKVYFGKGFPVSKRKGQFYGKYVIDEVKYRELKHSSLDSEESDKKRIDKVLIQRNILLKILNDKGMNIREIERMFSECDCPVNESNLSRAIQQIESLKYFNT